MKRRQLTVFFLAGLVNSLLISACTRVPLVVTEALSADSMVTTITVSAAASLQDALEAIAPEFHAAHPDVIVEYNFGSSGALQQQIERGAPADVFFSAAVKQMDQLAEADLTITESRRNVLTNSLVLIASANSSLRITEMAQLKTADINRLAVGEFRSVPAGQYAQQVLKSFELLAPLQSKLVFGSSVRNVLTAVESGNAELGIVYSTDAALSKKVRVLATAPEETHLPIVYPIAAIKGTSKPEASQTFIDFLLSEPAQITFMKFGFGRV